MEVIKLFWACVAVIWAVCALIQWSEVFHHARYVGCSIWKSYPSDAIYWTVVSLGAAVFAIAV